MFLVEFIAGLLAGSVALLADSLVLANVGVALAAVAVWTTQSAWPDIVVGVLICALFLRSAFTVGREARRELTLTTT